MFKGRKNFTFLPLLSALVATASIGTLPAIAQVNYNLQPEVEVEVELIEPGLGTVQPVPSPIGGAAEVEVILEESGVDTAGFFSCIEYPVPLTAFYSPEGSLPVIYWVSDYFTHSGWDPVTRCYEVASRFQRFYEEGRLDYITTGIVNRLPVVCVSSELGGPCTGVLLTLKPGEDASFVIQRLFDLSYGYDVGPLYESRSRLYLDFNQYLEYLQAAHRR